MATLTPTPTSATGCRETWLFKINQLQKLGCFECLLRMLGSLSFQVKETENRKKIVLHALSNKDNAGSIETRLSDMKELPDSLDGLLGLLGLFELLSVHAEEMEKKKKVVSHAVSNKDITGSSETRLFEMVEPNVGVQELEKRKQVVFHALSKKDNDNGVVSEKESDAYAGFCFYPDVLCMEKLPDSIEGLLSLLGSLSVQVKELEEKKKDVLHVLSKKDNANGVVSEKNSYVRPTLEDIIIVFVEEIEKANQYFDFEVYLKEQEHRLVKAKQENRLVKSGDDAFGVLKYLVYELKVQENSKFNKLDFKQILEAVDGNTGFEAFLLDRKALQETKIDWYSLMWPQEDYHFGIVDPILTLVYCIREKGHVMDENPLVELSFIINYTIKFYKGCVLNRLLYKYSEKSVTIYNLPLDSKEGDIKTELSICGEIVSCIFESSGPRKTAHVTFENSIAAKIALLLARRESNLRIYPTIEEEYEYKPKELTEYHNALTKYKEFRKCAEELRNSPKKMSN